MRDQDHEQDHEQDREQDREHEIVELTRELVRRRSDTSSSGEVQDFLAEYARGFGARVHSLAAGSVPNLWIEVGEGEDLFMFLGHTDVVPPGDESAWSVPPFEARVVDGAIVGRGVADMKGSIAAFLIALRRRIAAKPLPFRVGILLTGDEETTSRGAPHVLSWLQAQGTTIRWCLVGEPTCVTERGDTIKVGRRGSISAKFEALGIQGHVAYPHLADNPIHRVIRDLAPLIDADLDASLPQAGAAARLASDGALAEYDREWPKTSIQIVEIHGGIGATNVIPHTATGTFNIRYRAPHTEASIIRDVESRLDSAFWRISWGRASETYDSPLGELARVSSDSILELAGRRPLSTRDGGTSDGRFVATLCREVVEYGPCNKTIHQINESLTIDDLLFTESVYHAILTRLAT